jgi:hypothetical protein
MMACESLSTIEEREVLSTKTPFVQIFICPQDTIISAKVYGTNPTVGKGSQIVNPVVNNASIFLSNEMNQRIELKWNKESINYTASAKGFDIVVGKRYEMKLITPEGDNLTATCTIPQSIAQKDVSLQKVNVEPTIFGNGVEHFVKWKDFPNQQNYYTVFILRFYESTPIDIRVENEEALYSLLDDKVQNGEVITPKSFQLRERQLYGNGQSRYQTILVFNTDENYAKYHKTLDEILRNKDNPFAEPSRLYSNVKGGFGIFAGYNRTELKIEKLP